MSIGFHHFGTLNLNFFYLDIYEGCLYVIGNIQYILAHGMIWPKKKTAYMGCFKRLNRSMDKRLESLF